MEYKSYLYGIIASFSIMVLIDLIMPEGKMEKIVKAVSSLIIFLMLIHPLINFINSSKEIDISPNEEVSNAIEIRSDSYTEHVIENLIKNEFNINVIVEINRKKNEYKSQIEFVSITYQNNDINTFDEHINLEDKMSELVSNYLNIEREKVIIYE